MHQQNSLQRGIKISAPALNAAQQSKIHEQQKKQYQLKQQKRQLELDLINFKQAAKTFQTILNAVKSKPSHKENHSFINTNGQNLIDLLTKMKTVADGWVELKASQLNVLYEISVCQFGNLNIETQLQIQEGIKNEVEGKMQLHQKMITEVRQKIGEIEQRLNKCRANGQPDLQDRITEFVTQILSKYPNEVNEMDINLIKGLDFSALNYEILSQISLNKKHLTSTKQPLLSLRHQILHLHQQTSNKHSHQQDVQINRSIRLKNRQNLQHLTAFNNHLEANLSSQISQQVNQRKYLLSKSHLQSTDKYLMAGEYIIEGFKGMLGEEKFMQMREKLFVVKTQATRKVQMIDRQVRCEPMDREI